MKDLSPEAAELRDLFEDTLADVGATTLKVAPAIGLSQTMLSGFLRGDCEPRRSSLAKIREWIDYVKATQRPRKEARALDTLPLHPSLPNPSPGGPKRNWKRGPR